MKEFDKRILKNFLVSILICLVLVVYCAVMFTYQLATAGWNTDMGQFHLIFAFCLFWLSTAHIVFVFKMSRKRNKL
jgi:hypothetical protein